MPDADPLSNLILALAICGVLLLLVLLILWRVSARLGRIEAMLLSQSKSRSDSAAEAPSAAETSPGGAFQSFLGEDPARRELPKSEQFTAYRRWRQDKGMNWSKPADEVGH